MLGHIGLCNQAILVLEKVSALGVLAKGSDKLRFLAILLHIIIIIIIRHNTLSILGCLAA